MKNIILQTINSACETIVSAHTSQSVDLVNISFIQYSKGIPDTIKDKIYQTRFTTKSAGQVTRLGWSLSNDTVKSYRSGLVAQSPYVNSSDNEIRGIKFIIVLSAG